MYILIKNIKYIIKHKIYTINSIYKRLMQLCFFFSFSNYLQQLWHFRLDLVGSKHYFLQPLSSFCSRLKNLPKTFPILFNLEGCKSFSSNVSFTFPSLSSSMSKLQSESVLLAFLSLKVSAKASNKAFLCWSFRN